MESIRKDLKSKNSAIEQTKNLMQAFLPEQEVLPDSSLPAAALDITSFTQAH